MARTTGQFTPVIRCVSTAIPPYRFVQMTASNQGTVSGASDNDIIGVSDGSNILFDDADHANVGDPVRLQVGDIKRIECLAAVAAGGRVTSGAGGTATFATTGDEFYGIALQTGGAADFIDMLWLSGLTP